jgi:hypothetical protein
VLLCRRPCMRKCASTKNCSPPRRVVFVSCPQTRITLQENARQYDGHASGGLLGGLNTYAYVLNNPLRWIDPLGLAAQICTRLWTPHTFLCVDGNCSGKYPSGNPFASPGEIRDDSDNKSSASCWNVPTQKSDPNCFEQCVAKRINNRGPSGDLYNYGQVPFLLEIRERDALGFGGAVRSA